ncbi:MAG: right-handed parallel beta-helix repeat-containing protein [Clostridia bacterium]|nr:right-handed parallel beta-helix repeat-containing protein [Clostridia bacterium]
MKKKVLLSSIATIALCLCLIAGSTFALFTSESKTNIAVTSGNVDLVATVEDFTLYSVKADDSGNVTDENGAKYVYAERTDDKFANGGTAVQNGSVITLERITPGDKISFGIKAKNDSDVTVQCRYIIQCVSGEELMEGLVVYINDAAYPVLKSYTSAWTELAVGESITDDGNIEIAVELPVTAGNKYEKKEVAINVLVEAVQGNANVGTNNTDVIEFLPNSNATSVSDTASLKAALDNAVEGENIIVITDDITEDVVVTAKENVKTTIYGNGNTFDGVLTVDGKSATITSAGLTIKDFVFKADSISADACINLGESGNNNTRYTCNVTVENCTFDVPGAVGVKSYTGGDKNVSIINCIATDVTHSLAQLKGVDGVLVDNCKVYSKNGIGFNNSTNVVVRDCEIDVKGYAVRFGESSGGVGAAEIYKIENCVLKSANDDGDAVIILRGTADNSTLTIVNTTIIATNGDEIGNTATGVTIVR